MTALVIGPEQKAEIAALRTLAIAHPVDVKWLLKAIKLPQLKAKHMAQMTEQTIEIPMNFLVAFSIETGHPAGVCRHMSMSVRQDGRAPTPDAVWMVAEEFGFVGGLGQCAVYQEDLKGHGIAINIVQPVAMVAGS